MKHPKTIVAAALASLLLITATTALGKNKNVPKVYAFGFAASFNDSVVYFSEIQEIDNVWLKPKTNFLVERENYSNQLRDYLAGKGKSHRTCLISYALKRKDIEKKYIKMRQKYTARGNYDINYISAQDFQFKSFEPTPEQEVPTMTKAERKAALKAAKEKQKQQRNAQRGGKPQGPPPAKK